MSIEMACLAVALREGWETSLTICFEWHKHLYNYAGGDEAL